MKQLLSLSILLILLGTSYAQETKDEKELKATFATKIVHNSVAGFAPFFFANFETKKKFDISFYSIFWTNASFGNLNSGSDLLLETGAGLSFNVLNKTLVINPGVGLGHGKFSSNATGVRIAESAIPNLYVRFNRGFFDFEGYLAYYKAIREDGNVLTKDFLLNWAAPGINIKKRFVVGLFYEHFGITRIEESDQTPTIYTWLGGSVKLKLDNNIAFRFSAGPNLKTDTGTSNEFYKVSAFIPF
jgi:hypothetical protein